MNGKFTRAVVYLTVAGSSMGVASHGATAAAPPTGFHVDTSTLSATSARFTWNAVAKANYYNLYRNGVVASTTKLTSAIDRTMLANHQYKFTVTAMFPTGETPQSAPIVLGNAPAPTPAPPPAPTPPPVVAPATPTGFAVTPKWASSCAKCNGMAMAHVATSWNVVPNATYNLYRDGVKIVPGAATPGYTDMAVNSGQSYKYQVSAVVSNVESVLSAPIAAVAPSAPGSSTLTPPANLVEAGVWNGASTDALAWSPVPGAVAYNVYQYDAQIASNVRDTHYLVPNGQFCAGMTYTVTAVDSQGMETLPSAPTTSLGAFNPAAIPSWVSTSAPPVPKNVVATPEWNGGAPRIHLVWQGDLAAGVYDIYRDGSKIAAGVFGLSYFDSTVKPGESHTYTVSGINNYSPNRLESAQSAPRVATALTAPIAPMTTPVTITRVIRNDDSAIVCFNAVPGAVDYRVFAASNPASCKYSGGALRVEENGLDPVNGADLVVEAVDKLGPFQKMDGMAGPGAMQMNGTMSSAINGQGDPSDQPNVIARSATFHVTLQPAGLSGAQAFFDNFRNSTPFVQASSVAPEILAANGGGANNASNPYVQEFSNDKWTVRDYQGDQLNSKVFVMGNHIMDTLYDGGTPHTNVGLHNNNASMVFMPRQTADISGGKVLHVTFEVDAHMDGRRWLDLFVGPAGDTLINPGKFAELHLNPTLSGNMFRWEIQQGTNTVQVFRSGVQTDLVQSADWTDNYSLARVTWDGKPLMNGSTTSLDFRHKFDLYLSASHYRIVESTPDGSTPTVTRERDFPAGVTLPMNQLQVYFVHQVYHTGNDRPELLQWCNGQENYWVNYRPWCDERHWDNMGFEVLNSFPAP